VAIELKAGVAVHRAEGHRGPVSEHRLTEQRGAADAAEVAAHRLGRRETPQPRVGEHAHAGLVDDGRRGDLAGLDVPIVVPVESRLRRGLSVGRPAGPGPSAALLRARRGAPWSPELGATGPAARPPAGLARARRRQRAPALRAAVRGGEVQGVRVLRRLASVSWRASAGMPVSSAEGQGREDGLLEVVCG
jgi:hypothetical protein